MVRLTDKQERFCSEYVLDFNGTQACVRAGYSVKTANEQSSRLLANVKIQQRISELKEKLNTKLEKKYEISKSAILERLAKHALAEIVTPDESNENRDFQLALYTSMSRNQLKAIEVINTVLQYDKPQPEPKKDISVNINFSEPAKNEDIEDFKKLLDGNIE